MMALWSLLGALMCRVFPSSLRDLGLRWFEKIPPSSIGYFIQLSKSFVTQFIIKTKAPKGIISLLMLRNGKMKHSAITERGIESCTMKLTNVREN